MFGQQVRIMIFEDNGDGVLKRVETVNGVSQDSQGTGVSFENLGKPPKIKNGARTFNPVTGESNYDPGDVLPGFENPFHSSYKSVVESNGLTVPSNDGY